MSKWIIYIKTELIIYRQQNNINTQQNHVHDLWDIFFVMVNQLDPGMINVYLFMGSKAA